MNNDKQAFIQGYISTALWSSVATHPETGDDVNLDDGFEFAADEREKLEAYAAKAFDEQERLFYQFVDDTNTDFEQAGHTFWLSTNGHGAGFFDFTDSPAAEKLNCMCKQHGMFGAIYKGFDLYLGDDCLIYVL